ncbi:MAG: hypothetical protein ACR2IA_05550 [Pyrinomonadaceae bacterium]
MKFWTNKLIQSLFITLFLSCAAFAQERTWKAFSPETGAWTIFAPGVLKADEDAQISGSKKGSYSYTDSNGFFAVTYEDSAKWLVALSKPFIKGHYNKIRNSFIKSSKGELIKDEKFTNGKVSGREFYIKIPDGNTLDSENQIKTRYRTGRFRIFFHGNRCYMLIAVLPEEEMKGFAIDNYFNSFAAK